MKQFTLRIRCWRRDGSKSPTFRSNTGFNLYASNVKINESWFSRGSTCCLYSGSELKWSYPEMYINLQTFGLPHFALPVVPWTPILPITEHALHTDSRSAAFQPLRLLADRVSTSCWGWPWRHHCSVEEHDLDLDIANVVTSSSRRKKANVRCVLSTFVRGLLVKVTAVENRLISWCSSSISSSVSTYTVRTTLLRLAAW